MTAQAQPAAGMLKVLFGDISVTVRREISGARLAIGICRSRRSRIRSQWISSETITAPRVSSARRASSCAREHRAAGILRIAEKEGARIGRSAESVLVEDPAPVLQNERHLRNGRGASSGARFRWW